MLNKDLWRLLAWIQHTDARGVSMPSKAQTVPTTCRAMWQTIMAEVSETHLDRIVNSLEGMDAALKGDPSFDHDVSLLKELVANKEVSVSRITDTVGMLTHLRVTLNSIETQWLHTSLPAKDKRVPIASADFSQLFRRFILTT